MQDTFQVSISLGEHFQAATVEALSLHIEKALFAQRDEMNKFKESLMKSIDTLSEDEILSMLSKYQSTRKLK